ncbi:MAG: SET domain-containing protein-lysine N-methyltransferase [Chitinophagaceae bacterium]|nr:MAG: SET domain-containing protein-lysine N-methyltransferase [Chitinophagaceae bacterium]
MFIATCLEILNTENKGRGVFATENIDANTIIEVAPVIVMSKEERIDLDKTQLYNYIFLWENGYECCCVALGWVSIYNHAYKSNCIYEMNYHNQTISIITVVAIKKGEELTINYNGSSEDETPVWFDAQ